MTTPERRLLLAEMATDDIRTIATTGLLVLPVAATEQHGPHLPWGTDCAHTEHVVHNAAALVMTEIPIAVAPTMPFGASAWHVTKGGALSVSFESYYRVLKDIMLSIADSGFRRLFVVNGHGANHEVIDVVARDVAQEREINVATGSWWAICWEAMKSAKVAPKRMPGHAGEFETAVMMAITPALVALHNAPTPTNARTHDASPPFFMRPYAQRLVSSASELPFTDTPADATAEAGHSVLEIAITELAASFTEFHATAATDTRRGPEAHGGSSEGDR